MSCPFPSISQLEQVAFIVDVEIIFRKPYVHFQAFIIILLKEFSVPSGHRDFYRQNEFLVNMNINDMTVIIPAFREYAFEAPRTSPIQHLFFFKHDRSVLILQGLVVIGLKKSKNMADIRFPDRMTIVLQCRLGLDRNADE